MYHESSSTFFENNSAGSGANIDSPSQSVSQSQDPTESASALPEASISGSAVNEVKEEQSGRNESEQGERDEEIQEKEKEQYRAAIVHTPPLVPISSETEVKTRIALKSPVAPLSPFVIKFPNSPLSGQKRRSRYVDSQPCAYFTAYSSPVDQRSPGTILFPASSNPQQVHCV